VRRRLLVAMVGLVTVVLVAHDVPLAQHLRAIERDRLATATERDAFTLGSRISPVIAGGDRSSATADVADELAFAPEVADGTVVVVDRDGYLVASTGSGDVPGDDYTGRPEIAAALLGRVSAGARASATLGEDLVYVAVPVLSGDEVIGVIRISYPQSVLDARVNGRLGGLLVAALVSVAMAVVVALLFARSVSRPLEDLRSATDAFAAGDFSAEAAPGGPVETRRLARSFNGMAAMIGRLVERQRRFAGDASHQLRTPLTALRLRLEQASDGLEGVEGPARDHVDAALAEVDRLNHLVGLLLRLARAEGEVLERAPVDLSALVRERVEQWRYLAAERGVSIDLVAPLPVVAEASELAVNEIVDNYLGNAVSASPDGSVVDVMVERGGGSGTVVVRDRGPGMPPEERERAFERHWRSADSVRRGSGSGLGLAIVAQLAAASGANVELREAPTGGIDAVLSVLLDGG